MIDKLQAAEYRFDELTQKLTDPEVLGNSAAYRKTATEHSELEELVTVYRAYKEAVKEREEAKEMLSGQLEEEFRELVKEEFHNKTEEIAQLEEKLKIMLIPKDPNDSKNVIVEIRSGTGGEEAALFGAVLFRMYSKYAEKNNWKIETACVISHRRFYPKRRKTMDFQTSLKQKTAEIVVCKVHG